MDRHVRLDQQLQDLIRREALSRRDFLRVAASAGAVGAGALLLGGCGSDDGNGSATSTPGIVVDPPPETTRLRLGRGSICQSPQHLAEEFLPGEGFTDVQYLQKASPAAVANSLASGELDMNLQFAAVVAVRIDAGEPVTILAGAQVGCFELFATERVQSIGDLKGKTLAVSDVSPAAPDYVFMSTILTNIGIDPRTDVNFEAHAKDEAIQLLAEGKVDAFLAFPPTTQQVRAQNIGHVILISADDPPWSQYFCCLVAVNSDFFAKNPVATKRALRAILKGADVCAREPERAARFIVDKGYTDNYEYALDTMKMIPFNFWREFDPEDTLRFYSLRLNEAGIIKSTPDEIIRRGTDWRFLEELKQELAL